MSGTIRPNVLILVIMAALVSAVSIVMLDGNAELMVAVAASFITGAFAVAKDLVNPAKSDLQIVLEHLGEDR